MAGQKVLFLPGWVTVTLGIVVLSDSHPKSIVTNLIPNQYAPVGGVQRQLRR